MFFTQAERTVKKHTIGWCVTQAERRLKDRKINIPLCMNASRKYSESELLTTEQASNLIQELVDDSLYHAGMW